MTKTLYLLEIPLDVFDDKLTVLLGDRDKAIKFCKQEDEDDIEDDDDGWCVEVDEDIVAYLGDQLGGHSTTIHELTHAVLSFANYRNLHISKKDDEQELMAYLMGYVCGKVLDTPKRKWEKVI